MLFIQAMVNKSNVLHLTDSTIVPYSAVIPTAAEQDIRKTLGLSPTNTNTEEYKTTILILLRCARAIAHKCTGDITDTLLQLKNDILQKDTHFIETSARLLAGRTSWLRVPGYGTLPVIQRILLKRESSGTTSFTVRVTAVVNQTSVVYPASFDGDVLTVHTELGDVVIQGDDLTTHVTAGLLIAPCYTYPFKVKADKIRNSMALHAVLRNTTIRLLDVGSDIELLGGAAVGLAARGITHNLQGI